MVLEDDGRPRHPDRRPSAIEADDERDIARPGGEDAVPWHHRRVRIDGDVGLLADRDDRFRAVERRTQNPAPTTVAMAPADERAQGVAARTPVGVGMIAPGVPGPADVEGKVEAGAMLPAIGADRGELRLQWIRRE